MKKYCAAILMAVLFCPGEGVAETWRGLTVAPEQRCSPYNRKKDYRYPQSVESDIVRSMGGRIYGPYTGHMFESMQSTDIEHIIALSEAHDSGLCAANTATRKRFARDLENLTLASPSVNRNHKGAKDASEWLPPKNQCWFAARVVAVRKKYNLTIDRREAQALERVLSNCASTAMVIDGRAIKTVHPTPAGKHPTISSPRPPLKTDALSQWDLNGNGRITCAEARRAGIAPVFYGHPAYKYMRDGDGDGVVCE